MRVLFRADASATIGYGHLSRCLTLARALALRGARAMFAVRAPADGVRSWIAREGHGLATIIGDDVQASIAAAADADVVVVDSYALGGEWHAALRRDGRVVCVVDDLGDRPVRGDAVLNGNVFAERLHYDAHPDATLLVGPSYALVRDEFVRARAQRGTRAAAGRRRLLVTMGGADPANATDLALDATDLLAGELDVRVIVGGANPRASAVVARAAKRARHHVDVRVDVHDMAEHMLWADVACTAAGSTCLELACIGVPAVAIVVADNQAPVASELAARGMMTSAGRVGEVGAEEIARALAHLFVDPRRCRAMHEAQRRVVDGLGAVRAASALVSLVP